MSSTQIDKMIEKNNQEIDPVTLAESDSNWSFLGFELFDLTVVVSQAMFFLFAVPLDQFLLHPTTKFIGGIGFFVSIYYLGRTKEYVMGFKQINGVHQYLHLATSLGGFFSGLMVCVLVILPIAEFSRQWQIDSEMLSLILIVPTLLCAILIPWMASRADKADEETEFVQCSPWQVLAGRGFILIVSNIMLIHVYQTFSGESQDDLFSRSIVCSFAMCMFYIPIRVQEMFLRHQGPHFQSLIQTTLALIFCGSISPMLT